MASKEMTKAAKLQAKIDQLQAQIKAEESRKKDAQKKIETRKDFAIGAAVRAAVKAGEIKQEAITALLEKYVKGKRDRELLGLSELRK